MPGKFVAGPPVDIAAEQAQLLLLWLQAIQRGGVRAQQLTQLMHQQRHRLERIGAGGRLFADPGEDFDDPRIPGNAFLCAGRARRQRDGGGSRRVLRSSGLKIFRGQSANRTLKVSHRVLVRRRLMDGLIVPALSH